MRKSIRLGFAACALVTLGTMGCQARSSVPWLYPHSTKATVTQSPHEHYQSISNVAAQNERALIDDLDLLFMIDRPTRLTRWQSR